MIKDKVNMAPFIFNFIINFFILVTVHLIESAITLTHSTVLSLICILLIIISFNAFFLRKKQKNRRIYLLSLLFFLLGYAITRLIALWFSNEFILSPIIGIIGAISLSVVPPGTSSSEDTFDRDIKNYRLVLGEGPDSEIESQNKSRTEVGPSSSNKFPVWAEPPAPDKQANGPGPNGENPEIPAPAPIPADIPIKNLSFELSIRKRILYLENDNTVVLSSIERGEYWNFVKDALDKATTQQEYNILIECENRDLQIRESKHKCLKSLSQILFEHPTLAENAAYNPQEALMDFFEERRNALIKTHGRLSLKEIDLAELHFLDRVVDDLSQNGPESIYIKESLFFDGYIK